MKKVKISSAVYADLESIYEWIAQDDPVNAVRFIRALVREINNLNQMSTPGVARDDLLLGLRRVNFKGYAIFIRLPDDDTIEVVQVIYGGRDIPTHLRIN